MCVCSALISPQNTRHFAWSDNLSKKKKSKQKKKPKTPHCSTLTVEAVTKLVCCMLWHKGFPSPMTFLCKLTSSEKWLTSTFQPRKRSSIEKPPRLFYPCASSGTWQAAIYSDSKSRGDNYALGFREPSSVTEKVGVGKPHWRWNLSSEYISDGNAHSLLWMSLLFFLTSQLLGNIACISCTVYILLCRFDFAFPS